MLFKRNQLILQAWEFKSIAVAYMLTEKLSPLDTSVSELIAVRYGIQLRFELFAKLTGYRLGK